MSRTTGLPAILRDGLKAQGNLKAESGGVAVITGAVNLHRLAEFVDKTIAERLQRRLEGEVT